MKAGSDVVIVSSGSIAAGIEPLRLTKRPIDLATKQAAASVGQVALVNAWSTAFARYHRTVGQVLLTAHDISRAGVAHQRPAHPGPPAGAARRRDRQRERHRGHQRDPVRRQRSACPRWSPIWWAPTRWCCCPTSTASTTSDPRKGNARFISEVAATRRSRRRGGRPAAATWAPAAWRRSCRRRCWPPTQVCPCCWPPHPMRPPALADASVGTVFAPRPERMSARRFWVRYAAESAGALTLDDGAVRAVVRQRRSLLAAGITALSGRFYGGDVVELRSQDAAMVARGVVAYDHSRTCRRCWAARRRICPPRCAGPPCTPTTWSPSSPDSACRAWIEATRAPI